MSELLKLTVTNLHFVPNDAFVIGELEARKIEELADGDVSQVVSIKVRVPYPEGATLEEAREALLSKAREILAGLAHLT